MITFVGICAAMVVAALLLVARPLLTKANSEHGHKYLVVTIVALVLPLTAVGFYAKYGRIHWQQELAAQSSNRGVPPNVAAMIAKLEQHLQDKPDDLQGWLMLGRSYTTLEETHKALVAYQKAYGLSNGQNVEATLGVVENLVMLDANSLKGRAGEMAEAALAKDPNNVKALWYSAMAALSHQNLPRAHDRLQRMLALNLPDNIHSIVARQVQDIEEQMGQVSGNAPGKASEKKASSKTASASGNHAVTVSVSIDPKVAKGVDRQTPLFVLARDPNRPGPPLAVVRRSLADLPLKIQLTDANAMLPGHGIDSVSRAEIVARISKGGGPLAQPGDLYGQAEVDFDKKPKSSVSIRIDRVVQSEK